ncbi:MFS transporter [Streptomyces canus]|uniref:MFS transporter n=1 Tax=Streptomyces canus TaxID=58343 RepID=UPI000995F3F5|nr:MFS transporter [Streptomyces canus]
MIRRQQGRGRVIAPAVPGKAPTSRGSGRVSTWAPFAYGAFRILFVTQLVANVGRLMQATGSAWAIQDDGGSPLQVSLIQTATYAPLVGLGFVAGTLADRLNRRLLLIACQAWMALSATALCVATWLGRTDPLVVLALTFAIGLGTAIAAPTWAALQPSLVPGQLAGRAIALNGLTFNVAQATGPALAGLVIATLGTQWVFAINALSLTCTVLAILVWKAPSPAPRPKESFGRSLRTGLQCIMAAPQRQILARLAIFIVPATSVMALAPVLADERLGLDGSGFGALLATFGAGAALSVTIWSRVEGRGEEWGMVLSAALLTVALVTAATCTQPVIVGGALLASGTAYTLGSTCAYVAAQRVVDDALRARVMAAYVVTSGAVVAAASAGWGIVARTGVVRAFAVAAVLSALSLATRTRWPLPRGIDKRADDATETTPTS